MNSTELSLLATLLLGACAVVALYEVVKHAGRADAEDRVWEAIREAGFGVSVDVGGAWIRSRMPQLGIGETYSYWRKTVRGNRMVQKPVRLRLARREEPNAFVIVFLAPW